MIRSQKFQASWVGLGLVSCLMATGSCSHPATHSESTGGFRFSLMLSSLAEIDSVAYTVSGNGIQPIMGTIDVSGVSTTSAVISGLPAAMGYSLTATAKSTDGKAKCVGNTTFSVADGSQTNANLILECTGPNQSGTGVVRIDGTFDNCPVVSSLVAIPTGNNTTTVPTRVGAAVTLIGTYSDLDGDAVTFMWSQNQVVGSFSANASARTLFTCVTPGDVVVSLAVSDGTCTKTGTMSLVCVAAPPDGGAGGQSGTAAGGAPGIGGTGAGGATNGTGAGGTAAGGNGAGGTADGGTGAGGNGTGGNGVGGDAAGVTDAGGDVAQDTGAGGTGIGGTGAGGTGTGGAGAGGSGVGGGTGGMVACTATTPPSHCDSLVCEQCTFGVMPGDPDECSATAANCFNCDPTTMGCELMTDAADKALCENLYACLVAPTHPGDPNLPGYCMGPGGDTLPCWCGSNALSCPNSNTGPGKANGPCIDQILAASKLPAYDAPSISQQFTNPAIPLGAAVNLAICRGAFCALECVLPTPLQ